ncbi:sensor histidine kinase [Hyalangium versicolor]|uniref:sensor histidine kinase n=1 Tax=Hyalangium versicolor TaxID=2861190 RepID=UPI001CCE7CE5|nr:HAMP domain-containing sensor histidine kinase [Hyalangium versicolor]
MNMSPIPGSSLGRGLCVESHTPCLLFEAVRDSDGDLLAFRCVAANLAAEAQAWREEGTGGLSRWVESVAGMLELPACARVVETGEPYVTELHRRSGGTRTCWLATGVQRGDGFALWLRDVSRERLEEREALEALEQAQAREERMVEEAELRERFIGILGHDLRSPINAITLSVQALAQCGPLSSMQQELSQRVEASAARMAKMVADILDLTRARRSSGIPLSVAPASLGTVCRQVVDELATSHPDRYITYEEAGPSEGVWDAERLAQVVSNLVANALEHGGEDVPVFVRAHPRGELLTLEVHNPGVPIPENQLATLFEPFQRASASGGSRRCSGLGLGLYIVRELVHAHGGRVAVRSTEDEGTTFTVLLPRDARQATPWPGGPERHAG